MSAAEEQLSDQVLNLSATYKSGDFSLISSDGVEFKIPSHYLLSHSNVFRSMMEINQDDSDQIRSIDLIDTSIERSSVIEAFLDLIVSGEVLSERTSLVIDASGCAIAIDLARFLVKYDCNIAMTLFTEWLRKCLRKRRSQARRVFRIAAHLKDLGICKEAISRGGSCTFDGTQSDCKLEWGVVGAYMMDPTAWGLSAVDTIPTRYFVALARANSEGPSKKTDGTWEAVADKFVEIMEANGGA